MTTVVATQPLQSNQAEPSESSVSPYDVLPKLSTKENAYLLALVENGGDRHKAVLQAGYSTSNLRTQLARLDQSDKIQAHLVHLLGEDRKFAKHKLVQGFWRMFEEYKEKAKYDVQSAAAFLKFGEGLAKLLNLYEDSGATSQTLTDLLKQAKQS